MSIPILILGESGSGKSTSMRNLSPERTLLVQCLPKPLPFRSGSWKLFKDGSGSIYQTDSPHNIQRAITAAPGLGRNVVIVDDFQYAMANDFMRRSQEKGFDKFTEIGRSAWDTLMAASAVSDNLRIYFLWHVETTPEGRVKAKTIGKMLDEKITVEGMFSIVLRCFMHEGQHYFSTQSNGFDPVKTPIGMFSEGLISNDLATVDQDICTFYGIT